MLEISSRTLRARVRKRVLSSISLLEGRMGNQDFSGRNLTYNIKVQSILTICMTISVMEMVLMIPSVTCRILFNMSHFYEVAIMIWTCV